MDLSSQIKVDHEADISLIAQLTQQITWLIASEALRAGEKLPPIRDLAQALGIHMHTVRAAYQRLEVEMLVSMRPRVGTVVLPFDPNLIVDARPNLPSNLIGVLLPAPVPVYHPLLVGIQEAASAGRWLPIVCYTGENPLLTVRTIHQLIAREVDGFIVVSSVVSESLLETLDAESIPPIVYVDAPHMKVNSILADTQGAAYQATRHLIEHGHARLAMISAPLDWENVAPCLHGYQGALAEAGLPYDPRLVVEVPDFDFGSGYQGALEMLRISPRPTAAFVIADRLALGVMQALRESGVAVPGELALASYNDIEGAGLVQPGLTTCTFPAYEMGLLAMQRLQELLSGEALDDEPNLLETRLVIRQSCGCP